MKNFLIIIFSIFVLVSCNEPEKEKTVAKPRVFPEYHVALDEIIKTKDGVIRGVNLNSKSDIIKKAETTEPQEAEEDHLYYEYALDSLTNYSIAYALQK